MQINEKYTLMVGEGGAKRLKVLNQFCNPFTLRLLNRLGNLSGKKILDVGCGTGIMTAEFATRVGMNGFVTGVDISREQLTIAERHAEQLKLTNTKFMEISAYDLERITDKFDIIYCRFLLAHLNNSTDVIKKMLHLLKPQGYLIQEEPTSYEGMFSYPESDIFQRFQKACLWQVQVSNTDFYVGKELYNIYQKLKLQVHDLQIIQPVLVNFEQKQHLWLGIKEITPSLVKAGLTTEQEMNTLITDLETFINDDHYVVGSFPYMQILGQLH